MRHATWKEENDYALALAKKYRRMDRRAKGPSLGERIANKVIDIVVALGYIAAGLFIVWLVLL